MIFNCDFFDVAVEGNKPRLTIVEMDYGSIVPSMLRSSKLNTTVSIPEKQLFTLQQSCTTLQINITRRLRLQRATQKKRGGRNLVDPYTALYTNSMCLAGIGVENVEHDQPFRILIANFGDNLINLVQHQVVSTASINPEKLVEYHMYHAVMFC